MAAAPECRSRCLCPQGWGPRTGGGTSNASLQGRSVIRQSRAAPKDKVGAPRAAHHAVEMRLNGSAGRFWLAGCAFVLAVGCHHINRVDSSPHSSEPTQSWHVSSICGPPSLGQRSSAKRYHRHVLLYATSALRRHCCVCVQSARLPRRKIAKVDEHGGLCRLCRLWPCASRHFCHFTQRGMGASA